MQLVHAGAFTQMRQPQKGWTPGSASGGLNRSGLLSELFRQHAMDEQEMNDVAAQFVRGAKYARESGFDAWNFIWATAISLVSSSRHSAISAKTSMASARKTAPVFQRRLWRG